MRNSWRALLTLSVVGLLGLSGCSLLQDQAEDVVEHAIEEAVEGLNLTEGVPEGYPGDAVPRVDGEVRGASRSTDEGTEYVLLVTADDAGSAAADLLEEAGLEERHAVSSESGRLAEYSGDGVHVTLIASGTRVVYVVRPA
ncbi:hypothetical protein [Ruania halotolerans]|uniref:hypothetical protein n=1 Tax=Ruania halotolerans TaxID=2897773 RepID=UPI001E2AE68E|nr:hypothetical protein [Ruania halotolerans]UFU07525.1 hypothetical protein LQF10_05320 [Ruania halotolerans]